MSILLEIIEQKEKTIKIKKRDLPLEKIKEELIFYEKRSLYEKLKKNFGIIGEIKRGSPSAGIINKDVNFIEIAKIYEKNGLSGISVLTCEPYFFGKIEDLKIVRENVNIPILMKDFVIDEYQIYEGKANGADLILLIAKILKEREIKEFIKICEELNLEVIIEVHNYEELEKVFKVVENWENKILGINNRNLETLETKLENTLNLIKFIPVDKIIVISESGIRRKEEIDILRDYGIRGVLIGETFLKSKDIEEKIKEFKI
ncbi:MAG: indole-3-glycerol phosphate synthase TrpC [Candidatus Omnitrophica bacterium]|nr:indole-3-glycerol phosphate synthase TrpC [Candidatus Omnitrophota bacterium]MCM8806632.1 indole-3-glycerol phosphate synthase TrpC [Candidatus Omnitrophota bacterium]